MNPGSPTAFGQLACFKEKHLIENVILRSGSKGSHDGLGFTPASVNVFVGPNHSGKSLVLKELQGAIQSPEQAHQWKVLREVAFAELDDAMRASMISEIRAAVRPSKTNPMSNVHLSRATWGQEFGKNHFEELMDDVHRIRDVSQHHNFRNFFLVESLVMLGGAERLKMLAPHKRERPKTQYYGQLLSRLFYSNDKRKAVQRIVYDAFQCHFVIDPLGENFEVKISENEPPPAVERSLGDDAVDFFREATDISKMSDGVRAFCGMVAAVVASDAKVILIDEPEAFLHPALCVRLARELSKLARANKQQLFMATHSASFVMGCVQAGIDVNIIRLTYQRGTASSRLLLQEELAPLMRQPLLRSIGALTAIFYESVVVTEGDADRAFYDEVNHRCLSANHDSGISDCLFLNAQNWQTTARIIGPLRRLGVAASAIVDIDILLESKSQAFQSLVEAAGVPPSSRMALGQLRGQLHALLKPLYKELKSRGKGCVAGNDLLDLESLIDQLANYGVFLVPMGELESWLPNLSRVEWSDKSEWLLRTFEAMGDDMSDADYIQPSIGDVWTFLGKIRAWLQNPHRLGMPET